MFIRSSLLWVHRGVRVGRSGWADGRDPGADGEGGEPEAEPERAEGADQDGATGVAEFPADLTGAHGSPEPVGGRAGGEEGEPSDL